MLAETIRSGLVESTHHTTAIVVDASGSVLLEWGEPDRELFYRSAVKPFQATASLEAGLTVAQESLAVACSSHSGSPAHVAHVSAILASVGLDERALQTPPDWPMSAEAERRLVANGHRAPRRIIHNCSGKHAGWLAASVRAGYPIETYTQVDHPLQVASRTIVEEASHVRTEPVGVDGCGAPTLRGSVRGLARAFATLGTDSRFEKVAAACATYPALVSGSERPDGRLAAWWPGPMKGGAQGLLGASHNGLGLAVKAHSGSSDIAVVAMIEVMGRLGLLADAALDALADVASPPVQGGGERVGRIAPASSQ